MIPDKIDANLIIRESITSSEKLFLKDGIREQLRRGMVNPNFNEEHQRTYSRGYASKRRRRGLQTEFVDLRYTSQLHNSIKVVISRDSIKTSNSAGTYHRLISNFDWAKHSMDISRPLMEDFKMRVTRNVLNKIL